MPASPAHRVSTGERLNTAETTGKLQQAVAARRIRMTRQRSVVVQVMDDAEQHLDVDQILERAQKIDAGVHIVTVYRTIDLLKKEGLIDELDLLHLRGDRHYYETHGPRDHIHVACLRCGPCRTAGRPRECGPADRASRNSGGLRAGAADPTHRSSLLFSTSRWFGRR